MWPDGDAFGAADAEPEEDFMALREILFADLGTEGISSSFESGNY